MSGFSFGGISVNSKKHTLKLNIIDNPLLLDRSDSFATYNKVPVVLVDEPYEELQLQAIEKFLKHCGLHKFKIVCAINCKITKDNIQKDQKEGVISFYESNCSDFDKYISKQAPIITVGSAIYSLLKEDDIYPNYCHQVIFGKSNFLYSKDLTFENAHQVYPMESFNEIFARGWKKEVDSFKTKLAQLQISTVVKNADKIPSRFPKLNKVFINSKEEFYDLFYEPNKDRTGEMAWDLETGGLDFTKDAIGCITVSFDGITGYYIPWKYVDKEKMNKLFGQTRSVTANGKYDIKYCWREGLNNARVDEDVCTLGHTLDETRSNSLKTLAFFYSEFGGYERPLDVYKKKVKIDSYLDIDEDILKEYAVMDAIVTFRVWKNMMAHMRDLDKKYPSEINGYTSLETYYYTRRIPANNMYAKLEYKGVYVDKERLDNLRIEMQKDIDNLKAELNKTFGIKTSSTGGWGDSSQDFDWSSSQKVGKLLESKGWEDLGRTESGEYQVSDFQIKRWSKDHPEAKMIKELKSLLVMMNAFVGDVEGTKGWSQYLRYHPEDDSWRMHPDFFAMGTDSGRSRCQKPNMQNTPTRGKYAKAIKRCIITPDDNDYYMVTVDYSALQMRLATIDSQDKALTQVFQSPEADAHSMTAFVTFFKGKEIDVTEVEVEQDGVTYHFLGGEQVWTQRGYVFACDLQEDDTLIF